MASSLSERKRDTNRLVRALAGYVLSLPNVTPRQLYGLSKLTWITKSNDNASRSYVRSTKIPALRDALGIDFSGVVLESVAAEIRDISGIDAVSDLVIRDTGFTNFYAAYRNSVVGWIEDNYDKLLPMYRAAYEAPNRITRRLLVEKIMTLDRIPKENNPEQLMMPEFFLTPAFFALDPDIKFPLINGNKNVKALLQKLNVSDSTLVEQFDAIHSLYGEGGIDDAADVDSLGKDLPEFIGVESRPASMGIPRPNEDLRDDELPFKDEGDVTSVRQGGSIQQRREHNRLTNKLLRLLHGKFDLREGRNKNCMYDVLVKRFDGEKDLLIEVKSSPEQGQLRMAVGQLFDYWFKLEGASIEKRLAILLPEKPGEDQIAMLDWLGIGVLWFEEDKLAFATDWLNVLSLDD